MPTNRDLIAARQAQAPIAAPVLKPLAEARAEYNASYRPRYLDEVAPASIAGRLVKFKDGEFITVDDGQPMPEGAEYVALCDETQVGWKKFNGAGEAPERHMGLLFDNFEMPIAREPWRPRPVDVGTGPGQPAPGPVAARDQHRAAEHGDPGAVHVHDAVQDRPARGRESSAPLRADAADAVGRLAHRALVMGGYKHSDARVGFVSTPVFVVVGRAPRDGAAKSNGALNDDMPNF